MPNKCPSVGTSVCRQQLVCKHSRMYISGAISTKLAKMCMTIRSCSCLILGWIAHA